MAILASVVLTQVGETTSDARRTTARFNLNALRHQIQLYREEHGGLSPGASLAELLATTNAQGQPGSTPEHRFGPYALAIPDNPFTGSNQVRPAAANPPAAASGASDAGWLYHPATGGLWIDWAELLAE